MLHPSTKDKDAMSAFDLDQRARGFALLLENWEASRSGVSIAKARTTLARRLGIPAGTLENLRRNRLKGVRGWVSDKLESGVINAAEHEIQRWQHVREMARRGGNDARASEAEKVLAALLPLMKGER
jgi:hypothetical protein